MKKKILVLGAGMSASSLIKYLLDHSTELNWEVIVTARSIEKAQSKLENHPNGTPKVFDITNIELLPELISDSDAVISLLPAKYHPVVAKECLKQNKHLFTTSYVSPEMKAMDEEAKSKGLLFLNECGVDPGIDHMSAMKIIDEINHAGGKLKSFESNTGGLVAPEYDNNPWNYKFTWNARNVILAGQAGAKFLQEKKYKYIPYQQLFKRTYRISVLNYGEFDVYGNRDSLSYREVYGLHNIDTLFRGTLRRPGYCQAYDAFIQLGMTDDTYVMENSDKLTHRDYVEAFLPYRKGASVEDNFCMTVGISRNSETFRKIEWLGLFDNNPVTLANATPAQVLQSIIEPKWTLGENDLDMIVMQHRFVYELHGKTMERKSSLVVIGKDQVHTAMSITVGVPLAIAVKLFFTGEMKATGVVIPVKPEVYTPLLSELENFGVQFIEEESEL
jgi:saccharopine dehydrogenase-like NADP-dependent oxidoreductase